QVTRASTMTISAVPRRALSLHHVSPDALERLLQRLVDTLTPSLETQLFHGGADQLLVCVRAAVGEQPAHQAVELCSGVLRDVLPQRDVGTRSPLASARPTRRTGSFRRVSDRLPGGRLPHSTLLVTGPNGAPIRLNSPFDFSLPVHEPVRGPDPVEPPAQGLQML